MLNRTYSKTMKSALDAAAKAFIHYAPAKGYVTASALKKRWNTPAGVARRMLLVSMIEHREQEEKIEVQRHKIIELSKEVSRLKKLARD